MNTTPPSLKLRRGKYDAFGSIVGKTGLAESNYLFTNQEFDNESELYYYNARYYNPTTGRFISRDPFLGRDGDVLSRNSYIYVQNNPLKYVDPTGEKEESVSFSELIQEMFLLIPGAKDYAMEVIAEILYGVGGIFNSVENHNTWDKGMFGWLGGKINGMIGDFVKNAGVSIDPNSTASESVIASAMLLLDLSTAGEGRVATKALRESGEVVLKKTAPRLGAKLAAKQAIQAVAKLGKGSADTYVYRYFDDAGNLIYTGITKSPKLRELAHRYGPHKLKDMKVISELGQITRNQARAVEQVLIESRGLGQLKNKINSIARDNPIYDVAKEFGENILKKTGVNY
ncbi:MAG: RHS repeat-associated core domain-containing protein [Candidatus Magasanikbacteria bacterium]